MGSGLNNECNQSSTPYQLLLMRSWIRTIGSRSSSHRNAGQTALKHNADFEGIKLLFLCLPCM